MFRQLTLFIFKYFRALILYFKKWTLECKVEHRDFRSRWLFV